MIQVQTLEIGQDDADMRLDRWLRRLYPHVTQAQVQKFARTGQIRIDGKRVDANTRLSAGQKVRVPPLPEVTATDKKTPKAMNDRDVEKLRRLVLFKDDWVIALNKPAGLAVQGGSKLDDNHLDAMLDALAFDGERPKLVHRLDKDTSGVLLLARTAKAARNLAESFRGHDARKYYWAITVNVPQPRQGRIDAPLVKLPGPQGERMRVDEERGQDAATLYEVVEAVGTKAAWVALWPLTGRTHQLRAHLDLIDTPIFGDVKYNVLESPWPDLKPKRLHLHAHRLIVPHPSGKGRIDVKADLPADLVETWKYFGFGRDDGDPFAGV